MYQQISSNKRRTILLMVGFVGLITFFGWVLSRATATPGLAFMIGVFALIYAIIGYFASASIALAVSGAKPVSKADEPELYRVVENLAISGGLPQPKIYIINDPAPNAFAAGRDPSHSVVAVTSGLLQILDKTELEGVIGHELSHVGNFDIRLMSIIVVLVGILTVMSDFFLRFTFFGGGRRRDDDSEEGGNAGAVFLVIGIIMAILVPIAATIIQLAISRNREYLADASGALLTRYPEGLASALAKIDQAKQPLRRANSATAHLYISSPVKGAGSKLASLFNTHPPIADRIKRLEQMEISV
jgi:heat shock protein HtpX